ncbi:MAG: hypothetical protein LBC67_06555 [Spirochaetales bacterium]|jgi:hypothetical protein|nr:hypothetical protein [Spirochaetales bacterium]
MSENKENSKRRRRRRHPRRPENQPSEPLPERETPPCALCGSPIRDILSAVLHRETGEPAHFDCIAKELLGKEPLAEGEKFSYLGNGNFGIVRQGGAADPSSIVIRKKIQYEDKEKAASWRRTLSIKI